MNRVFKSKLTKNKRQADEETLSELKEDFKLLIVKIQV